MSIVYCTPFLVVRSGFFPSGKFGFSQGPFFRPGRKSERRQQKTGKMEGAWGTSRQLELFWILSVPCLSPWQLPGRTECSWRVCCWVLGSLPEAHLFCSLESLPGSAGSPPLRGQPHHQGTPSCSQESSFPWGHLGSSRCLSNPLTSVQLPLASREGVLQRFSLRDHWNKTVVTTEHLWLMLKALDWWWRWRVWTVLSH